MSVEGMRQAASTKTIVRSQKKSGWLSGLINLPLTRLSNDKGKAFVIALSFNTTKIKDNQTQYQKLYNIQSIIINWAVMLYAVTKSSQSISAKQDVLVMNAHFGINLK